MKDTSRRFKDLPIDDDDPISRAMRAVDAEPPATRRGSLGGTGNFMTRVAQATGRSLQEQIDALQAQVASGKLLLSLDPKAIELSPFANRHKLSLDQNDPDMVALRESIRKFGQERPICVRPVASSTGPQTYELVEGHRRHAACLALDAEEEGGWPIHTLVDGTLTESKDFVLRMFRENDQRTPLSAYETGLQWKSWLSGKIFTTHAQIAEETSKSEATVYKYIRIAELPGHVLAAFRDPRTIALRWGSDLERALKTNPRAVEAAAAALLDGPEVAPEEVFRTLVQSAATSKPAKPSREEAVKIQGKVAFRIATKDGRLTIKFAPTIAKDSQRKLCEEIKELIEMSLKSGRNKP